MTPLRPSVQLRRESLLQALRILPPTEIAVLVLLVLHACPRTGIVWASPSTIAERLRLTTGIVESALTHLVREHCLSNYSHLVDRRGLMLGSIFIKEGEAPDNIPVEPAL